MSTGIRLEGALLASVQIAAVLRTGVEALVAVAGGQLQADSQAGVPGFAEALVTADQLDVAEAAGMREAGVGVARGEGAVRAVQIGHDQLEAPVAVRAVAQCGGDIAVGGAVLHFTGIRQRRRRRGRRTGAERGLVNVVVTQVQAVALAVADALADPVGAERAAAAGAGPGGRHGKDGKAEGDQDGGQAHGRFAAGFGMRGF